MIGLSVIIFLLVVPVATLLVSWFLTRNTVSQNRWSFANPEKITIREVLVGIGVEALLLTVLWVGGVYVKGADTQVLNGSVVGKHRETVSCSHSYSCNCTTDKDGNTTCQTCHEHFFDYNWVVEMDIGSVDIARIDRQGEDEPPRFTAVKVGEPAALQSSYQNYIKASQYSLFDRHKDEGPAIPYPEVYDYYRADHAFDFGGGAGKLLPSYNRKLAEALKVLGPNNEVNVILVFGMKDMEPLRENLEATWAKKNDVVVLASVVKDTIVGVEALALSKTSAYQRMLKDNLVGVPIASVDSVVTGISRAITRGYQRQSMEDFEYLKWSVFPSTGVLVAMALISLLGSVAMVFIFRKTDF